MRRLDSFELIDDEAGEVRPGCGRIDAESTNGVQDVEVDYGRRIEKAVLPEVHALGLRADGKFFAFTTKGQLVVKLPAARVTKLIASGAGQPCDFGRGRPMKEWARLTPADESACSAYVLEARGFVAAQTNP